MHICKSKTCRPWKLWFLESYISIGWSICIYCILAYAYHFIVYTSIPFSLLSLNTQIAFKKKVLTHKLIDSQKRKKHKLIALWFTVLCIYCFITCSAHMVSSSASLEVSVHGRKVSPTLFGIQIFAIRLWLTVRSNDTNPNSINSKKTQKYIGANILSNYTKKAVINIFELYVLVSQFSPDLILSRAWIRDFLLFRLKYWRN